MLFFDFFVKMQIPKIFWTLFWGTELCRKKLVAICYCFDFFVKCTFANQPKSVFLWNLFIDFGWFLRSFNIKPIFDTEFWPCVRFFEGKRAAIGSQASFQKNDSSSRETSLFLVNCGFPRAAAPVIAHWSWNRALSLGSSKLETHRNLTNLLQTFRQNH